MSFNRLESKPKNDLKDRVFKFSVDMVKFVDRLPKDMSGEVIARQVLRSSTSIGANVHEAQAGASRKDFALMMGHALKSSNETLYWLRVLRDAKKVTSNDLPDLVNECEQLCKILGSIVSTLRVNS